MEYFKNHVPNLTLNSKSCLTNPNKSPQKQMSFKTITFNVAYNNHISRTNDILHKMC